MQSAIPYSAPVDLEEGNRIKKLAEYVARNGPEFEAKVREKEASNPMFTFLNRSENLAGYCYYQWILFCSRHFYSAEQMHMIEEAHRQRVAPAAAAGALEIVPEDHSEFTALLAKNGGTKEIIRDIRNWFMDRSHSAVSLSFAILDFMKTQRASLPATLLFQKLLYTVYATNDIIFNAASARSEGHYTTLLHEGQPVNLMACLMPQLPAIMRMTYEAATTDAER
jgi:hypothetical protein